MTKFNNLWNANYSTWFGRERDRWLFPNTINEIAENEQNRPSWNKVYEGYPKDGNGDDLGTEDVFKSILGDDYNREIFTNACATRVSIGLLSAGVVVKKDFPITVGRFKGKGFIASAIGLKKWLTTVWGSADIIVTGPTDITDVQNKIGVKNGVYIILGGFSGGISGHATLWLGSDLNTVGNHNYVSYGGTVYFWELL